MIPIGDSVPRYRSPTVNYLLIATCVAAFLFELTLGPRLNGFLGRYGVTPANVSALLAGDSRTPGAVVLTLLTTLFLHGGWLHLVSNMLFLWIFGDNVEDRLGHLRYLGFYLLCGVAASLVQVHFDPTSRVPIIGASGAIAGVLGAYLYLYPTAWVRVLVPIFIIFLPISLPVVLILGYWFVTQLANGVASITDAAQASGGVASWAHVGGFVVGMLIAPFFPRSLRPAPTMPPTLAGVSPVGRVAARVISAVGGLVELIVVARVLLLLAAPTGDAIVRVLANVVIVISWPLVQPFAGLLPVLRVGDARLELYALLALAVYHLLTTVFVWALTSVLRPRAAGVAPHA